MSIQVKLSQVRPRLSLVSPLVARIILVFGFGNILLGYGLFIVQVGATTRRLPIVNDLLNFQFHGSLFILLGLVMLYGYWKNDWRILKTSLVAGLFVKTAWLFCLVVLAFHGGSISLLASWLMLTVIQAVSYIHFIPGLGVNNAK